jgi:hypothetical protein
LITKKIAAYGASVVVALIVGVALMATASAAPSVGDVSVTITGDTTQTLTALDANRGQLTAALVDGDFSIVTQPASGGSVSITTETTTARVMTEADGATGTGSTITVDSTANFPTSGFYFIDDGDDVVDTAADPVVGVTAADEIISCTGKTTTTLTGCTRGVGNSAPASHVDGTDIHPIQRSVIALSEFAIGDTSANLADASDFASSGTFVTFDATIANVASYAYTSKSGTGLVGTGAVAGAAHPIGTDVIQFGRTVDTADVAIDVDAGFAGSFTYEFDYDLVAGDSTVTVTVIGDNPVASDVEATVSATLPTPLPVIVVLSGSDSSSVSAGPSVGFASLPTKGVLSTITPTLTCTDVTGAVIGEVLTNCVAQVVYTPLAGATGTDTFTYTIENGGDTSAAATVTIILPGGTSTTPGAGFTTALVVGVNLTTYGGGTVAQLGTDAAAAGATSVSVTVGGSFVVYVVGAPDFVNVDFATNFSGGVPAGTVVLVLIQS